MLIGAMNDPCCNVLEQIQWIAETGLEFLDLTLEPPGSASWQIDIHAVAELLSRHHLKVVGHTAPYLPIASPMEGLRQAAICEFKRCIQIFHEVGAPVMNIHPGLSPMHSRSFSIEKNLQSLHELLPFARDHGVVLMVENAPCHFNTAAQLGELLEPLPELGLHFDIGHANLATTHNTTEEVLSAYGSRVKHVHLHDNKGGDLDLHLPLGAGNIDMPAVLRALKSVGYDGTITLEVFSRDRNLLAFSRDVLGKIWSAV